MYVAKFYFNRYDPKEETQDFTKMIANRFQDHILKCVHKNQYGFSCSNRLESSGAAPRRAPWPLDC
jgi:hypothetical protein